MRWRLRSYEGSLPGNYCWKEGNFNPPCQPTIEAMAAIVSAYRKGNGMPRSDLPTCIKDVDSYQCQRLGNNPTYCTCANANDVIAMAPSNPYIAPPCHGCGAPVPQDTRQP